MRYNWVKSFFNDKIMIFLDDSNSWFEDSRGDVENCQRPWFLKFWPYGGLGLEGQKIKNEISKNIVISKIDKSCWTSWRSLWKHKIRILLQIGFKTNCWDIFSFSIFMENAVFYLPRARQTDVCTTVVKIK